MSQSNGLQALRVPRPPVLPPEARSRERTPSELLQLAVRMDWYGTRFPSEEVWRAWAYFWKDVCLQKVHRIGELEGKIQRLEACTKCPPHSIAQVRTVASIEPTSPPKPSLSSILGVTVEPVKPETLSGPSLSQTVSIFIEPTGPAPTSELSFSPVLTVSIEPVQSVQPAEPDGDSDTCPKYQDAFLSRKALIDYLYSRNRIPVRPVLHLVKKVAQGLAPSRVLEQIQQIREKTRHIRFRKPWYFEAAPQIMPDGQAPLVPCEPAADLTGSTITRAAI
ncbi:hypothetical protein C8A03DRAFT_29355 [Achaetomium macrosporum]|uniref:Uncharacterized protein n=1 Tax=Achaetomium macrosporum TaxID=79813 RepID=A0AAN7CHY3_9PEZI|nr:hypothetical protein C8A03DRAFT_29355 [Achaetomium macrosporum]